MTIPLRHGNWKYILQEYNDTIEIYKLKVEISTNYIFKRQVS